MGPPRLSGAQVAAFLGRIGVQVEPSVSPRWLTATHLAHLRHVPFENIELHAGRPIDLEVPALFDKVVVRGRGGYCYELNGLFASLLATVGFDVTMVSCQVWMPEGELTPPFDHLALLVELDGDRWLVDVGFGDSFLTPRPLGAEWEEPGRRLRTIETGPGWQLEKDDGDGWTPMYRLDLTPRALSEFLPRSRWHENSSDSPFRRGVFATRSTEQGRVTVTSDRLIVTEDGERSERQLEDRGARRQALERYFSPALASDLDAATAS